MSEPRAALDRATARRCPTLCWRSCTQRSPTRRPGGLRLRRPVDRSSARAGLDGRWPTRRSAPTPLAAMVPINRALARCAHAAGRTGAAPVAADHDPEPRHRAGGRTSTPPRCRWWSQSRRRGGERSSSPRTSCPTRCTSTRRRSASSTSAARPRTTAGQPSTIVIDDLDDGIIEVAEARPSVVRDRSAHPCAPHRRPARPRGASGCCGWASGSAVVAGGRRDRGVRLRRCSTFATSWCRVPCSPTRTCSTTRSCRASRAMPCCWWTPTPSR